MEPLKLCMVKIEKIEFYKCEQCPRIFVDSNELTKHAEYHEQLFSSHVHSAYVKLEKLNTFPCDSCSQSFISKDDYLLHKLTHIHRSVINKRIESRRPWNNNEIEKPYACPECDYKFVAKSTLEAHSFVHQPFEHICPCGIGYYRLRDLEGHQKLVKCLSKLEDIKPKASKKDNVETKKDIVKVKFSFNKRVRNNKKLKKNKTNTNRNLKENKGSSNGTSADWTLLPLSEIFINFEKIDNKFRCPECKVLYSSKRGAQQHYRTIHMQEHRFICNICQKAFTQIGGLKSHLKIHYGIRDFKCDFCDKPFHNYHSKDLHERVHTGIKPYKCPFCDKCFSDPSSFARHKRIHQGDMKYRCKDCPKAFTDSSALYVHRKRHQNKRDHKCTKCERSFYTLSDCIKHVQCVHEPNFKYQCDHCKKRFSQKNYLVIHILRTHNKRIQKLKCPICSKFIADKQGLKLHILVVHKKIKRYKCDECYQQFYHKGKYENHKLRHTNRKEYECDYCSKKFFDKKLLSDHIRKRHLNLLTCMYCSQKFSNKVTLKRHIFKKYKRCKFCDKKFICKYTMTKHSKCHADEKLQCDHCKKFFKNRAQICMHMTMYHSKRTLECDNCGQMFATKKQILSHMMTYHMEVLRCNICYKKLYSTLELNKHKKNGCNVKKYVCVKCNKCFTSSTSLKCHQNVHMKHRQMFECPWCKAKYMTKKSIIRHFSLVHNKNK